MTNGEKSGGHLSAELLLDYFETKLAADRERSVEEHLAECHECAAVGREVYAFHHVWQWSAPAHGRVQLREVLSEAVRKAAAEAESAPLRQRLERWARDWSGRAEAALHVITEVSASARRAVGRPLDDLARPGSEWSFQTEPSAVPVRGAASDEQASAVLTTALTPGKPRARVVVHAAEHGEVVVRLDGVPREQAAPIILLIAVGGALTVRVAEASRQPGADYRIARFTEVTPGDYLVAFEPMVDAD